MKKNFSLIFFIAGDLLLSLLCGCLTSHPECLTIQQSYHSQIELLSDEITANPDISHAYIARGDLYTTYYEFEKAIQDFNKAIEINPDDAQAYASRGFAYLIIGNDLDAIWDFTKVTDIEPSNVKALSRRAQAYIHIREFDRALEDCNKAIELAPDSSDGYVARGMLYSVRGKEVSALNDFDKAIELDPKNDLIYVVRGNFFLKRRIVEHAYHEFRKALKLNPDNDMAHAGHGKIAGGYDKLDKAIKHFDIAIALKPKNPEYYSLRAITYRLKGQVQKALDDYSTIIALNQAYQAYSAKAKIYYESGHFDKALDQYNQAILLNPDDLVLYENRIYVHELMGNSDGIIDNLNEIILRKPYNLHCAGFYEMRGLEYFLRGDYDKAVLDFNHVDNLERNDTFVLFYRYIALKRNHRDDGGSLSRYASQADENSWEKQLADMLLGHITPDECLKQSKYRIKCIENSHKMDANFFIGQYYLINGNVAEARKHYTKSLGMMGTKIHARIAQAELARMPQTESKK